MEGEVNKMGWKSVDLQVAIPRTQDASNLQDQMTKQHQRFQDSLAQHQLKEQLEKRKQVNEYNETNKLKNDLEKNTLSTAQENKDDPSTDDEFKEEQVEHPYKGRRFDLTR